MTELSNSHTQYAGTFCDIAMSWQDNAKLFLLIEAGKKKLYFCMAAEPVPLMSPKACITAKVHCLDAKCPQNQSVNISRYNTSNYLPTRMMSDAPETSSTTTKS